MIENIPNNAMKVNFNYGRVKGYYHIWKSGEIWYWSALGNSGEERSQQEAFRAAYGWIKTSRFKQH